MRDAIIWLIKSYHWLVITGLIITVLGTLYTAYSFLDKNHWLLKALSRFLLLTMISTIIGGLLFAAFGIMYSLSLYLVQLILPDIYVPPFPTTINFYATNFSLIGVVYGWFFGVTFEGNITGHLFKGNQLLKKNTVLKKAIIWLLIGSSSTFPLFLYYLLFPGFSDIGPPMIHIGVPIGIILATSGGLIGDTFLKQPKLRLRTVRKKDSKGDFYDHPYWLFRKNWLLIIRIFLIGAVSGGLSWGFIQGFNSWLQEYWSSLGGAVGYGWTYIIYQAIVGAIMGGVTLGCLLVIFNYFGPFLAFNIERKLSEHQSGRIGLILALFGSIISTLASLLGS